MFKFSSFSDEFITCPLPIWYTANISQETRQRGTRSLGLERAMGSFSPLKVRTPTLLVMGPQRLRQADRKNYDTTKVQLRYNRIFKL
jgi:hypothetical protein